MSQYLDLAYAVVVDERVRRGMPLFDALDDTREYAASRTHAPEPVVVATAGGNTVQAAPPEPERANIGGPGAPLSAEDLANARALATLNNAMSNVQGGFG